MALLRVNAVGQEPILHKSSQPIAPVLRHFLVPGKRGPHAETGPVTIFLHGYKFQPESHECPHDLIFAMRPKGNLARMVSWPRHLGFGDTGSMPGVAICFGWNARGSVQRAYDSAADAGVALGALCRMIKRIAPTREVHVLSHSMGARVALQALHHVPMATFSRLVLMAAAEFAGVAREALETPAGRHVQVTHVSSRENDFYDLLLELFLRPQQRGDQAFGTHLSDLPNLRNVMLDDAATLDALARLGFRIAPPERRICHWSPYLRAGVFGFYRALLSGTLEIGRLDAALPRASKARWSRLMPTMQPTLSLPFSPRSSV